MIAGVSPGYPRPMAPPPSSSPRRSSTGSMRQSGRWSRSGASVACCRRGCRHSARRAQRRKSYLGAGVGAGERVIPAATRSWHWISAGRPAGRCVMPTAPSPAARPSSGPVGSKAVGMIYLRFSRLAAGGRQDRRRIGVVYLRGCAVPSRCLGSTCVWRLSRPCGSPKPRTGWSGRIGPIPFCRSHTKSGTAGFTFPTYPASAWTGMKRRSRLTWPISDGSPRARSNVGLSSNDSSWLCAPGVEADEGPPQCDREPDVLTLGWNRRQAGAAGAGARDSDCGAWNPDAAFWTRPGQAVSSWSQSPAPDLCRSQALSNSTGSRKLLHATSWQG